MVRLARGSSYLDHAVGPDPYFVYRWLHADRSSEIRETAAAYSRAAELSADRFALLACQDLGAVLRLFSALSDDPVKPADLLATGSERAERLLARGQRALGDSLRRRVERAILVWRGVTDPRLLDF